jgi:hypothetical protein
VARKGRARRFREARELKQGFDDGMFAEGGKTLADLEDADATADDETWDDADDDEPEEPWDPDVQLQGDPTVAARPGPAGARAIAPSKNGEV